MLHNVKICVYILCSQMLAARIVTWCLRDYIGNTLHGYF